MRRVKRKFIKINDVYVEITRIILALFLFTISMFLSKSMFQPRKTYSLVLNGNTSVDVSIKNDYTDAGFKFLENNKKIEANELKINVKNDVDTNNLGQYAYTYEVIYKNTTYTAKRIVNVVDNIPPVIKTDFPVSSFQSIIFEFARYPISSFKILSIMSPFYIPNICEFSLASLSALKI